MFQSKIFDATSVPSSQLSQPGAILQARSRYFICSDMTLRRSLERLPRIAILCRAIVKCVRQRFGFSFAFFVVCLTRIETGHEAIELASYPFDMLERYADHRMTTETP